MTDYRRIYAPGSTWFFTVNLLERQNNNLLVEKIDLLRNAFSYVKKRKSFTINAVVIMPDHLHCVWTLPDNDTDYSSRWSLLKSYFSRSIPKNEHINKNRIKRRERGIWQRRFWAHWIVDQNDFNQHIEYIHWNPVKHGYVARVIEWQYSSFHRYVEQGIYPANWGHPGSFSIDANE